MSLYRDRLNRDSWLDFLACRTKREYDPERRTVVTFVNGRVPSPQNRRRRRRWVLEGDTPRLGPADEFLVDVGLRFQEFEDHCEEKGLSAWR